VINVIGGNVDSVCGSKLGGTPEPQFLRLELSAVPIITSAFSNLLGRRPDMLQTCTGIPVADLRVAHTICHGLATRNFYADGLRHVPPNMISAASMITQEIYRVSVALT